MLAFLVALALLVASVAGVYWLLKSMGEDGVEAAAPGSCKSGRCGVAPSRVTEEDGRSFDLHAVRVDDIQRAGGKAGNQRALNG
ncbi:MAG TPA: hypothetical protein PLL19_12025 [Thiobacillaceae bacterium]|nr:hypothetical protein [Thiobacillaceae bacterium]HNA83222.1 hypothetical protein [Thiobacillaceae bacterium]HNF90053.1 hypothetical protein [Thiobacillaceae bacterium]HNH90234.1 hypothetical protein [Thiobacillaceae bacterium]HNI07509.1 hypothetical protein [Thiobacillaceae bacterium]